MLQSWCGCQCIQSFAWKMVCRYMSFYLFTLILSFQSFPCRAGKRQPGYPTDKFLPDRSILYSKHFLSSLCTVGNRPSSLDKNYDCTDSITMYWFISTVFELSSLILPLNYLVIVTFHSLIQYSFINTLIVDSFIYYPFIYYPSVFYLFNSIQLIYQLLNLFSFNR